MPSDTWWGDAPLLDSIQFTVISPDAVPQAFANNELDSFDIGPDPNGYALAFNTPGAEIRAAAGPNWRHVTLNSGPNGGLIQDQVVRQAIQMSLDRAAIGVSDLAGIPWPAKPLNNHIFVENYAVLRRQRRRRSAPTTPTRRWRCSRRTAGSPAPTACARRTASA